MDEHRVELEEEPTSEPIPDTVRDDRNPCDHTDRYGNATIKLQGMSDYVCTACDQLQNQ